MKLYKHVCTIDLHSFANCINSRIRELMLCGESLDRISVGKINGDVIFMATYSNSTLEYKLNNDEILNILKYLYDETIDVFHVDSHSNIIICYTN